MRTRKTVSNEHGRAAIILIVGQIKYQLLLLRRSPMSNFTTLVLPIMLLLILNYASPQESLADLHGIPYENFLTPAMMTFALLNASYVSVITSVATARDRGVLKRLHGTPLPLWGYVTGRMASAAVMGIAAVAVVYAIGLTFLHTDMPADHLPALLGVTALGVAAFTTAGMAVCSLVPRANAALASAYGTMLPITFISNVFFPGTGGPSWLKTMADAFPIAPVAKSAEQLFAPAASAWPMTHTQLIVLVAWIGGASLVTAMAFRWEAGTTWLSRWLSGARRRFAAARA